MWLRDEAEGAQVAQADAGQDDEAKLSAGRFHHRRVMKADEHQSHEDGGEKAEAGEHHRRDGFGVAPLQIMHRDGLTTYRTKLLSAMILT